MEEYLAVIKIFAGSFAPRGYFYCAGQMMNIAQNTALFSLLGTTFGGDGRTTFALPDFRGKVPVGSGVALQSGVQYAVGDTGGSPNVAISGLTASGSVTLNTGNLPAHTHAIPPLTVTVTIPANKAKGNADLPGPTAILGKGSVTNTTPKISTTAKSYSTSAANTNLRPFNALAANGVTASEGSGGPVSISLPVVASGPPVSIMQPYLAVNFIICAEGIFPSRP